MKINLTLRCMASLFATIVGVLTPLTSEAALKCEELTAMRSCKDSAPKSASVGNGNTITVPAPVLPGFASACWIWGRQFQCVETEPQLYCDSGSDYALVKSKCSLTKAAINATVRINGLSYITDADYTYHCEFGTFTPFEPLPTGKECVLLKSTLISADFIPSAPVGVDASTGTGNPPTTAPLSTEIDTRQVHTQKSVCYSNPETTCSNTCYKQIVDPTTGQITQQTVACTSPVSNCVDSVSQCVGEMQGDTAALSIGPDGRCVKSNVTSTCSAGAIPKCLTKDNCSLTSLKDTAIQDNGVATRQEQTYTCSNTTKSCKQQTEVSNCTHMGAWGWDKQSMKSQAGQGLAEFNQAMAKLEGIQKGAKKDDPHIFSGKDARCSYAIGNFLNTFITIAIIAAVVIASGGAGAVFGATATSSVSVGTGALVEASVTAAAQGLTTTALTIGEANTILATAQVASAAAADAPNSQAFGSNCCKEFVVEGTDSIFKLSGCTADEVRLGVARKKGLTHYIGEYCSKKSGFPVRQCVKKTRTFCAFDDMLALTVNEQGREQLEKMAAEDLASTSATGELTFPLYSSEVSYTASTPYKDIANGKWVLRSNQGHSQVWSWQYPGYCVSAEKQTAAHNLWMAQVQQVVNTKGILPDEMTAAQAASLIVNARKIPAFQECPETQGMMAMLTCSRQDDNCDTNKLPESPTSVGVDISGGDVADVDVNWRVQLFKSFKFPGDYDVTSTMVTDSSYAAVTNSVNEFVTAVGSCHTNGACLYKFSVTDKQVTAGLGARRRLSDNIRFPLYTLTPSSVWPAVTYVAPDGTMKPADYLADPNKGQGDPFTVGSQRFIFHPNFIDKPVTEVHSKVLLEWATNAVVTGDSSKDYTPLLVPTSLPPATSGWYPYNNQFYLSGGCDPNSKWCDYKVEVNLNLPRHPWGSPQEPRCWGFTIDQLAALDFDKMDLSRWVNSLNLNAASPNLSADAAKAMTDQATSSAQAFYNSFKTGTATNDPNPGKLALRTNTDMLPMVSNEDFKAYTLKLGVEANWPQWFETQANNNPVTNVVVDWGDGSAKETITKDPSGRAYIASHDYGKQAPGKYKVSVTLDTSANGAQSLSTNVTIMPNSGGAPLDTTLDYNNPGADGKSQRTYVPSAAIGGTNQSPAFIENLSPATANQFKQQGDSLTK